MDRHITSTSKQHKEDTMKGKTTTGFEFEIQEEVLNDYELLEKW